MMAGLVTALGVLGFFLAAPYGIAGILVPSDARPPRHARPAGRTEPTERAPSPPLAEYPLDGELLRLTLSLGVMPGRLSPINRESMRRRFRVMWWQAQNRPTV